MKIGVLALQGGFAEHIEALDRLGAQAVEIRDLSALAKPLDGLILPGGESTVMGRLLQETGLLAPLREKICQGLPVFGTCAGMILAASAIEGSSDAWLSYIDLTVRRNAFGRQMGSFTLQSEVEGIGIVPMTFIRAPVILETAPSIRPLARVRGHLVAAEWNNILVTAFHPELTDDLRIHRYFLDKVKACRLNADA